MALTPERERELTLLAQQCVDIMVFGGACSFTEEETQFLMQKKQELAQQACTPPPQSP